MFNFIVPKEGRDVTYNHCILACHLYLNAHYVHYGIQLIQWRNTYSHNNKQHYKAITRGKKNGKVQSCSENTYFDNFVWEYFYTKSRSLYLQTNTNTESWLKNINFSNKNLQSKSIHSLSISSNTLCAKQN